jgi:HAD superfamily hydrolase (TIGR01509 family)
MVKFIIFDLDGVLIDAKEIHYNSLNEALKEINESFIIKWDEHLSIFDGLKTNEKLNLLTKLKNLPIDYHKQIWDRKQVLTLKMLENVTEQSNIINTMKSLRDNGYKIACCSNSIRKSVFVMLSKIGVVEYMDLILSNEDVKNSKPHPEIYWKAMSMMNFLPEETLIVEDSPPGLLSANRSNAHVLRINKPIDISYDKIMEKIENLTNNIKTKWTDKKLNVLIPMAGAGSRFEKAGYTFPKPLIEVNGKPMIQVVVENLNIDANYIFIVQKSHREKYNLDTLLNLISPNCNIIDVDGITEGAACTALLAKNLINNDNPLFFANSDQFVDWDSNEFMYKMNESNLDGGIVTFESTHPKWSFAKVDDNNLVTEVAEKNPISNNATVGFYYWKSGKDFVKYAESMINKNIRVNNEFYVCPVFNEAINDGKKIKNYRIDKMWGIGTPEDLKYFIDNKLTK